MMSLSQRENIKAVKILLFRQLKKNSRKQELIWYRRDFKDDPKIYKKEGVTSHERE